MLQAPLALASRSRRWWWWWLVVQMTDQLGIEHYSKHPDLVKSNRVGHKGTDRHLHACGSAATGGQESQGTHTCSLVPSRCWAGGLVVVQVTVVAPNPDVVKKAQIFRNGLVDAWQSKERVGFAMFSRAPVVKGTQYHREAELLGDVAGSDVIIVDEIVDTANTLVRVANVLKVRRRRPGQQAGDSGRAGWGLRREGRAGGLTTHLATVVLSVVQEKGAKNIYVFAAHGIFTSDALFKIESTPHLTSVVVTNTIPLPPHYSGHKVSTNGQPALDLPCPGLT